MLYFGDLWHYFMTFKCSGCPFQVLLSLIMVFYLVGWSAIVGGLVVLMLAVTQYFVAAQLSVMQRHISV